MIVPTYETTAKEQEMMINELRSINRTQENRINIQEEEIHKKEAMYDSLAVDYRLAQEEIERLNNIIKEVREYVEKHSSEPKTCFYGIPKYRVFNGNTEDVLRLLDNKKIYGDKIQVEWYEESILDKGE